MDQQFVIRGGRPLKGEVEVRGSKNAAPKLMIASLLTDEECVIENVPLSSEVDITKELCEAIGSKISVEGRSLRIQTPEIQTSIVHELSRRNRIPILALGPLLHRKGLAEVPVLGGCPIGHRPINFHVEALNKMGAKVERRENSYYAEAPEIHGALIELPYPSVGATETVILTASLARGVTQIRNAAVEPEIINLIDFLRAMGAKIDYDEGSRKINIRGVEKLHGATIKTMPDRSEIVSFVAATLATDGETFLKGIKEDYLASFLEKIKELGGKYETTSGGIRFRGKRPYNPIKVETSPHPGFMTDWQQPFSVLLTQADGESIIHETVYEDRFGYVKDLERMGARVRVSDECLGSPCRFKGLTFNHSAVISGPVKLNSTEIEIKDIRAGMAHVVAALAASGESVISGVRHIDRGYEKLDERLRKLGADIKRV